MPFPERARRRVAVAAVDERVAVALLEQPQVDVIERERQRHPQPEHARRDFARLAGRRGADPDTIDAWTGPASRTGGVADPDGFEQYLPAALKVSARETVGTAMYLLNPRVAGADGEWEALFFAHWVPGVRRFPSFWALMQAEPRTCSLPLRLRHQAGCGPS